MRLSLADEEATRALGKAIAAATVEGLVVALNGELGAGKTTLAQGVGEGLGCAGPITSPTFQLLFLHEDGRLPLYHADLYRLRDASELIELGFDEILGVRGVSLVEWAERFPEVLPADHLEVTLSYEDEGRSARITAHGPLAKSVLGAL